ncbi:hypothetical protein HGB47_04385 [Leptospira yasudae]|uniref:hypothetical protein n=1 Tax=Leptospira yasudae TaxID=2202201 RepID=UPI001C4E4243|nr:hypothetical protein [Leptospira yasudae]MBW0432847.1 hypothetical protein [Leptospira yasudae]
MLITAVTFWISWFLTPDPGTTDTNHILRIVKAVREFVWISAITQIVSSACYTIALFLIADLFSPQKKTTLIGLALFGIGAMGMCADAFFHLPMLLFLTATFVGIGTAVVAKQVFGYSGRIVSLSILGAFAFGQAWIGLELLRFKKD